jgi:hypothetical protein
MRLSIALSVINKVPLQPYAVILTPHLRLPGLTISESQCPSVLSSKLGVTEMGQLHWLAL